MNELDGKRIASQPISVSQMLASKHTEGKMRGRG
jgi:hypothetical protein